MNRTYLGLAAFALTFAHASSGLAFCRTTTCDPNDAKQKCQVSAGCVTTGKPLHWYSSCVTIGVQQLGAPTHGLAYDDIANVVESAFGAWQAADCNPGKPSIDVKLIGPVECGLSEYNSDDGNANIVLFRSGPWPYIGAANAIGLTTTRFDKVTGELWDADIELNGEANLSIGDPVTGDDLLSVLTHEAGHFLGLSHSLDDSATMKPVYDPTRDGVSFRSLASDDVDGICTIYPPERAAPTSSCENRHGFASECGDGVSARESKGCSVVTPGAETGSTWAGLLLTLAAVGGRRLARRRCVV